MNRLSQLPATITAADIAVALTAVVAASVFELARTYVTIARIALAARRDPRWPS